MPPADLLVPVVRGTELRTNELRDEGSHIDVGNVRYSYFTVMPSQAAQNLPVLIALHGLGGDGRSAIVGFGLEPYARREGFILIAPSAPTAQWHDQEGDPLQKQDLDFFKALLDEVPKLGGDPKRVYVTGFSNGGGMAHVLAANLGDRIAAVAAGGASVGDLDDDLNYHGLPDPKRPISILMFHGMQDQLSGYDMSTFAVAIPDAAKWWAEKDGLPLTASHHELAGGKLLVDRYSGSADTEVVLMSYRDMGHAWPTVENQSTGVNFNETLWKFLSRHRLPG